MNDIRTKLAESDMRHARKHGELVIGQTTLGTVQLKATPFLFGPDGSPSTSFWYELRRLGPIEGPRVLAEGRADTVRRALAAIYQVEVALA